MSTQIGSIYTGIEPEKTAKIEDAIQEPIRANSESRDGRYPVITDLGLEQLNLYYDKSIESVGAGYNLQIVNVPSSQMGVQRVHDLAPVLYSALEFTYDDYKNLPMSRLKENDRIAIFGKGFAEHEDVKAIIGDSRIAGIHPITDTTNVSTALTGTTNFTTIANIHATISGIFDQIDDNYEYNSANKPIAIQVTRDGWGKARRVLDETIEFKNGLEYAKDLVQEFGGPGSQLYNSKYLGGSAVYDPTGKVVVTAGTTNISAHINTKEVLRIRASGLIRDEDPNSVKHGKYIRFGQRWVFQGKQQAGIFYGDTLVV